MVIDRIMRSAIIAAVDAAGGQSALARKSGVPQRSISRYVCGANAVMNDRTWRDLFPCVKDFIEKDKLEKYTPSDIPQSPMLVSDFKHPDSELSLIDAPRFMPVPVISIAQAAEYEPLEPLVDYLREVSDRTQLFVDVKDNYFAVEITGDSMAPDYPNGSVALVAAGEFPERGDIVVAKFSTGQVVIKEYHRKDGVVSLLSRNPHGQNFEWNIKEKPGFIQWMFPVIEIVLHPRRQRHTKGKA